MKKLLLFPLIIAMCGGYVGVANADNEDVDTVCTGNICGYIPSGGGVESDKCKVKNYWVQYEDPKYVDYGNCYQFYWKTGNCTPSGAPRDSGECKYNNQKVEVHYNAYVDEESCATATNNDWGTSTDNVDQRSCTAKLCNNGFLLQTTSGRKEIKIVKEVIQNANKIGDKVGSDGICRSKDWLNDFCESKCSCDNKDEKCVLNEFTVENYKKNVQAFDRKRTCVCVKKSCDERYSGNESAIACCEANKDWDATNNTCKCADGEEWKKVDGTWKCEKKVKNNELVDEDGSPCKYILTVDITCPDGKTFHKNEQLTKEQYKDLTCKDFNDLMKTATNKKITTIDFVKNIQAEVAAYNKLLETVCGKHRVTEKGMDVDSAKSTLTRFFANAKENASVWKTEEGNFNGTRLASDLTAGVVLGTVGGVVSSNVIKKNQIEKGFEVLHCTIGGQNVADWGDTFNTGLRK